MFLINPVTVDPADFTTNVTEDDAATWNAGTTYALGDRVIYVSKVYESLQDSNTGNNPATATTWWIEVSVTNPYRMFDGKLGSPTSKSDSIEVTIDVGELVTGMALFNIDAASVQVIVTDAIDGEVYNETFFMADYSPVSSHYTYFFSPITTKTDLAITDLPTYAAPIDVIISKAGGVAECGELILGLLAQIGRANYGTNVSIRDFSSKNVDGFGNISVAERDFIKRANYDFTVDTGAIGFIQRQLAALRAIPTVYIGDPNREETIVYGFYKNFGIPIESPLISDATMEVEGLN